MLLLLPAALSSLAGCGASQGICTDTDLDGACDEEDCAPNDPSIAPNKDDIPDDGIDQDCDGQDTCGKHSDCDNDGKTPAEGDCDDTDPQVGGDHPGSCEVEAPEPSNPCVGGNWICTSGGMAFCDPIEPKPEICNAEDDDCNGVVDDGAPGQGQTCITGQLGKCSLGLTTCISGAIVCAQVFQPTAEVCDAAPAGGTPEDEDCDGIANPSSICTCNDGDAEDCYEGTQGTQGIGPCKAGKRTCTASGEWGPCLGQVVDQPEECDLPPPGSGPQDEDCDGIANDGCICNTGEIDDDCYDGPPGTEKLGVCTPGTRVCINGFVGWGPCEGQVLPQAQETCDNQGYDEDCDGKADLADKDPNGCTCIDGYEQACKVPGAKGECQQGVQTCSSGQWGPCTSEFSPPAGESLCDGKDENCDGYTDNFGFGVRYYSFSKSCDGGTMVFSGNYSLDTCQILAIPSIDRYPVSSAALSYDMSVTLGTPTPTDFTASIKCSGNNSKSISGRILLIGYPVDGKLAQDNNRYAALLNVNSCSEVHSGFPSFNPPAFSKLELMSLTQVTAPGASDVQWSAPWNGTDSRVRILGAASGNSAEALLHRIAFASASDYIVNCVSDCVGPGDTDIHVPKLGTHAARAIFSVHHMGSSSDCPTALASPVCEASAVNRGFSVTYEDEEYRTYFGEAAGSNEVVIPLNYAASTGSLAYTACVIGRP